MVAADVGLKIAFPLIFSLASFHVTDKLRCFVCSFFNRFLGFREMKIA